MTMKPEIIPVIHYHDDDQAERNAQIAKAAGITSVMFIQMQGRDMDMARYATKFKDGNPDINVGINCLSASPYAALLFSTTTGFNMTWTDDQVTHSLKTSNKDEQEIRYIKEQLDQNPQHRYFVGCAFKHQDHEPRPDISARRAISSGMIPTTSGSATGVAANVDKIANLRELIGADSPLAIASGITPENVGDYAPFLTHILVATGISSDFHNIDQAKLEALMNRIENTRLN